MNKDIIIGEEAQEAIKRGVNKLSAAVLKTMGPNGSTVIIVNGDDEYATKDGVSVAKAVKLLDLIEDIGARMIKEVAKRTVELAGDGTTTSICLANALINKGFELLKQGVSYRDIKLALDQLEKDVLSKLSKMAKPLKDKDIINVATISANNDEEIGKLIYDAYKHSEVVKVEESENTTDTLELINGMKVLGSYYDKAFINNTKKSAVDYMDCELIIVDDKINHINEIKTLLEGTKTKPIVIIADDYHTSVISILKDNYNRGALDIALLKSPGFATHRRDLISDIIEYTSASVHNFHNTQKPVYTANVDSILATKDSIIFTKKNVNIKSVNAKVDSLKEMLQVEKDGYTKELLQQRIENLEGKLSVIKVGGNSELEMKEKKDRMDDAVLAVKCALEEGYIPGGGHALKNISRDLLYTKTPIIELSMCLHAPYETIGCLKINDKIIDPVKVTRCAFENAMSVAKTILNSQAIVIGDTRWR